MFGLGGGLNPAKMKAMMQKLGINQEEVSAKRVVIERDEGNIVIENPNIQKIKMQGQESWQITGEAREEEAGIKEEDVALVAEKTGKSKKEAKEALEKTGGDIAEAIVELTK
ncbi:MAG: nascent polypeptide-associated complex protein [Candidatus Pacearchaeota archaeon]